MMFMKFTVAINFPSGGMRNQSTIWVTYDPHQREARFYADRWRRDRIYTEQDVNWQDAAGTAANLATGRYQWPRDASQPPPEGDG